MKKMSWHDRYLIRHKTYQTVFLWCWYNLLPTKVRTWIEDHREPLEEIHYMTAEEKAEYAAQTKPHQPGAGRTSPEYHTTMARSRKRKR